MIDGSPLTPARVADGDDPLADPKVGGGAHDGDGEGALGVDLEHRGVGVGVGAEDPRPHLPPALEHDLHGVGGAHDVGVGEHVPVAAEDHPAADRAAAGLRPHPHDRRLGAGRRSRPASGLLGDRGGGTLDHLALDRPERRVALDQADGDDDEARWRAGRR